MSPKPMSDAEIDKLGRKLKLAPFMFDSKEFRGAPVKPTVRPLVPKGAVWTRHHNGSEWWWTHGDYLARKDGGDGLWLLRYRGKCVGNADFLQDVMQMASDCGEAGHAEGRCGNATCLRGFSPLYAIKEPK